MTKIVNPTAGAAGFHDNKITRMVLEDALEVSPFGFKQLSPLFFRLRVKKASH